MLATITESPLALEYTPPASVPPEESVSDSKLVLPSKEGLSPLAEVLSPSVAP